eukprot:7382880-Pyramimonas_sp.AAC.1
MEDGTVTAFSVHLGIPEQLYQPESCECVVASPSSCGPGSCFPFFLLVVLLVIVFSLVVLSLGRPALPLVVVAA